MSDFSQPKRSRTTVAYYNKANEQEEIELKRPSHQGTKRNRIDTNYVRTSYVRNIFNKKEKP